jgi:hypothetical protein
MTTSFNFYARGLMFFFEKESIDNAGVTIKLIFFQKMPGIEC